MSLFKCEFCDFQCKCKRDFTLHVNAVHKKLRPYSCGICDKSFSEKGSVRKHISVIHEKKKEFACHLYATRSLELEEILQSI